MNFAESSTIGIDHDEIHDMCDLLMTGDMSPGRGLNMRAQIRGLSMQVHDPHGRQVVIQNTNENTIRRSQSPPSQQEGSGAGGPGKESGNKNSLKNEKGGPNKNKKNSTSGSHSASNASIKSNNYYSDKEPLYGSAMNMGLQSFQKKSYSNSVEENQGQQTKKGFIYSPNVLSQMGCLKTPVTAERENMFKSIIAAHGHDISMRREEVEWGMKDLSTSHLSAGAAPMVAPRLGSVVGNFCATIHGLNRPPPPPPPKIMKPITPPPEPKIDYDFKYVSILSPSSREADESTGSSKKNVLNIKPSVSEIAAYGKYEFKMSPRVNMVGSLVTPVTVKNYDNNQNNGTTVTVMPIVNVDNKKDSESFDTNINSDDPATIKPNILPENLNNNNNISLTSQSEDKSLTQTVDANGILIAPVVHPTSKLAVALGNRGPMTKLAVSMNTKGPLDLQATPSTTPLVNGRENMMQKVNQTGPGPAGASVTSASYTPKRNLLNMDFLAGSRDNLEVDSKLSAVMSKLENQSELLEKECEIRREVVQKEEEILAKHNLLVLEVQRLQQRLDELEKEKASGKWVLNAAESAESIKVSKAITGSTASGRISRKVSPTRKSQSPKTVTAANGTVTDSATMSTTTAAAASQSQSVATTSKFLRRSESREDTRERQRSTSSSTKKSYADAPGANNKALIGSDSRQNSARGRVGNASEKTGKEGAEKVPAPRKRSSSITRRSFVQAIPGISPDQEIQDFVNKNPTFPVQIQKISENGYRFGRDTRTKVVVQMTTGNYVKVGGGFESLAGYLEGLLTGGKK